MCDQVLPLFLTWICLFPLWKALSLWDQLHYNYTVLSLTLDGKNNPNNIYLSFLIHKHIYLQTIIKVFRNNHS